MFPSRLCLVKFCMFSFVARIYVRKYLLIPFLYGLTWRTINSNKTKCDTRFFYVTFRLIALPKQNKLFSLKRNSQFSLKNFTVHLILLFSHTHVYTFSCDATFQTGPGLLFVDVHILHRSRHKHTHNFYGSSECVISPSEKPLPSQNTTNTRDENACP